MMCYVLTLDCRIVSNKSTDMS